MIKLRETDKAYASLPLSLSLSLARVITHTHSECNAFLSLSLSLSLSLTHSLCPSLCVQVEQMCEGDLIDQCVLGGELLRLPPSAPPHPI